MAKQLKRRTFLEKTVKGMAAAGLITTTSFQVTQDDSFGKKFIHHVFFWLKTPVTNEVRVKFEKGLTDLIKIDEIVDKHLGTPAATNRGVIDNSYTYSLLVTFRNKEDQDVYQTHPIHLKFIADCQDLWEKVVVYDSVSIR